MNCDFVVCDLETTGLNPFTDKIIEIGLVCLENGQISGKYHTLVNPRQPLDIKIKRLTGINDQDLAAAPVLSEILPQVLDFIGERAIAGHNIDFDLGFLAAALGEPLHNQSYDTLELARIVVPCSGSFRLSELCRSFDIELKSVHRALDDAVATAHLLTLLIQKLYSIDINVLMRLTSFLAMARSRWHDFASKVIQDMLKVFPDQKISNVPYWRKENTVDREIGARNRQGKKEIYLFDPDCLAALVGEDGLLAQAVSGYEYRPQQEAMVRKVAGAFCEEKYLLLEAGTGVGKSMAYLIPALFWSLRNKERVVVATHTINLQEQLWFKDIPLLAGVIGQSFRAALAKGRQNYICLRRWLHANPNQPEEAAFYAKVLTWLALTITGDRTELNTIPGEEEYWLNICGDSESCLGTRCRYRADCFVYKAKKTAEEADLIITNHSLLFLDIMNENQVLPTYGPLIIDEAHHLEDSATNHLARQVTQGTLNRWFRVTGKALENLAEVFPPDDRERWMQILKSALQNRLETIEKARLFFQVVSEVFRDKSNSGDISAQSTRLTLRLSDATSVEFETALSVGEELSSLLRKLTDSLQELANIMELWSISAEEWAELAQDLGHVAQTGLALAGELIFILKSADEKFVYWADVEYSANGKLRYCNLSAAPINIGEIIYENFYKNKKTVVFASATLSVNGSCEHFIERSGLAYLPDGKLTEAYFDSPFIYEHQALLCISRDLPAQNAVTSDLYIEKLTDAIASIVSVTQGKTLVLFTSHRILRETYRKLKPKLEIMDIYLLGHGIDGSRTRILEEFKTSERAVLFGASSFWEGVDVPGEALTCVIMVKLPFWSPKIPVVEARLADLAKNGRNSFADFCVPQAVIRFKQGFGRLIRSGSDHGCVVVLDARILGKNYGRQFLSSLPLKSHIRGSNEMIAKKMADWFNTI